MSAFTLLAALFATANWVDNRYETRVAADAEIATIKETITRDSDDAERGRIQNEVDIDRLKLDYLRQKKHLTADDVDQIKYLQDLITRLQLRLDGIK